jgi:glucokinase
MTKYYGGIDLGGTFIKAGLLSENGDIIHNFAFPSRVEQGIPALKESLRVVARKLVEESELRGAALAGIGVGSPGTIIFPDGIVTGATPNIPGWVGTNISGIFSDFPFPVVADNDANCMGLAEATFGAGKGTKNGFYLTLGTGVGGAMFVNGAIVRGASFCAGEFGHMVLVYNGDTCKTGRKGCLEQYVAAGALCRSAMQLAGKYPDSALSSQPGELDVVDIFDAFKRGDQAAVEAVSANADMVGVAIGSVVNLLNPEIVVIGGGMSQAGEKYIGLIRKSVFSFAFESTTSILKVEAAKFGNDAGWIGAACLNIGSRPLP